MQDIPFFFNTSLDRPVVLEGEVEGTGKIVELVILLQVASLQAIKHYFAPEIEQKGQILMVQFQLPCIIFPRYS